MAERFNSFKEFYPYYLSEHQNNTCRRIHVAGSLLIIATLIFALMTQHWVVLWLVPIFGYGFAWFGHFVFEKNKPATFQYPFYSFLGDWTMLKDVLTGKVAW